MKRNESTNDKIVRLFNEGWEAERIADDVKIPVGSVNSILERRVEGYADLLAKKSLEANKARTAAKEEALRREREKQEALEAKQAKYSTAKKPTLVNPDDFFNSDLDGMLVGNYKQKITEPEKETVNILTADENRNLLTAGLEEEEAVEEVVEEEIVEEAVPEEIPEEITEEEVIEEVSEEVCEEPVKAEETAVPVIEVDANPMAAASQKMALFAKAQIAENEQKIESINALIADITAKITASDQQNEAVKTKISAIDDEIQEIYQKISELNEKISSLEEEKTALENEGGEDTTEFTAQVSAYNEQITALKTENEEFRAFIK